ncbi:MAG: hypothetical protein ACX939_07790 [Hyphococcus sp.]
MTRTPSPDAAVNALIDLLSREKSALLSGAYDAIADITEQKQHYLAVLSTSLEDPAKAAEISHLRKPIEQIQSLARENESLLNAARNGASSARTRIKNIMTQEAFVGAYTADGQKLRAHDSGVTRCQTA